MWRITDLREFRNQLKETKFGHPIDNEYCLIKKNVFSVSYNLIVIPIYRLLIFLDDVSYFYLWSLFFPSDKGGQ